MAVPAPVLPAALNPASDEPARPAVFDQPGDGRRRSLTPTTSSPTLDRSSRRLTSVSEEDDRATSAVSGRELSSACPSWTSSTSLSAATSFSRSAAQQTPVRLTDTKRGNGLGNEVPPTLSSPLIGDREDNEKFEGRDGHKESSDEDEAEAQRSTALPADEDEWTYPDGGYQAWSVYFGVNLTRKEGSR